jgi:hypothetical protein
MTVWLGLTLALLVAGVRADDAQDVLSLHDAARFAQALDGGSYFHGLFGLKLGLRELTRGQKIAPEHAFRASAI